MSRERLREILAVSWARLNILCAKAGLSMKDFPRRSDKEKTVLSPRNILGTYALDNAAHYAGSEQLWDAFWKKK